MDEELSPTDVRSLLQSDASVRVIDIRDPASFERGHIPDSENLPFEELPARVEELEGADHIVAVCPHGKASVQAANLIGSYEGCAEARVVSMAGGLEAWSTQFELEHDAADDTMAPF